MRFPWRSDDGGPVAYKSTVEVDSASLRGVRFRILRISFGRRMELFRRIKSLAGQLNYFESSSNFGEQVEASILSQEIENLYIRWGLVDVSGLLIDDQPATPETLIECGPEALSKEIVAAIRAQCGLTEEERKN